jgi:meiotically up-regulated gene 157 (Mug157) protein
MVALQNSARSEVLSYGSTLLNSLLSSPSIPADIDKDTLGTVFYNSFTYTANSTWEIFVPDCTTFVTTGDISQMWLRDSSAQMLTYVNQLPLIKMPNFRSVMESILLRQLRFFIGDPYGSAFFDASGPEKLGKGPNRDECMPTEACPECTCTDCTPACSGYTYQHDYELDSPLFMFLLHYKYYKASPSDYASFITMSGDTNGDTNGDTVLQGVRSLLDLMKVEQHHNTNSGYYYKPLPRAFSDYTGMVWSFARPSDDQTDYGYNVPQNLFAVSVLEKLHEMNSDLWNDVELAEELVALKDSIVTGIKAFGISDDGTFSFEVDGLGNRTDKVLDDANNPNLLWLPYIDFKDDGGVFPKGIYERTRNAVLSDKNLNYFTPALRESTDLNSGLGSQHETGGLRPEWPGRECTRDCIWHLGLIMQGLTAQEQVEEDDVLRQVLSTAWHGYMHEGFSVIFTKEYNRDWFGWGNSMFAEWIIEDYLQ